MTSDNIAPVEENKIDNKDINQQNKEQIFLLISVFFIAVCGLCYELLFGTISSYLLGDTILQFSLSIGVFMSSMGLGAYISKYMEKNIVYTFINIEIWIALFGGFSASILFFAFAFTEVYSFCMYLLLIILGTLIGLEIPLVTRIIQEYGTLKITLSRVFSLDYIGALFASILFPVVFLPYLGLMQSSFFFGLLNLGVTIANIVIFYKKLVPLKRLIIFTLISGILLIGGLIFSYKIESLFESVFYEDEIIFTTQTKYQRIVLTRWKDKINLFLDGNLQFSSVDEYRYHETLVHPALTMAPSRKNILVLGGGDGLALREILKYKDVEKIKLVDIDPEMINICSTYPMIVNINKGSLKDSRVEYIPKDAWSFIKDTDEIFDIIIIDLPDPENEKLSKLYSETFYRILKHHLSKGGLMSVQSTSTFFSTNTYWCIYNTIEEAGFYVKPVHTLVPTFGDWGFVLASNEKININRAKVEVDTRYLNNETLEDIFKFSKDIAWRDTMVNTIINNIIIYYYNEDWSKWQE